MRSRRRPNAESPTEKTRGRDGSSAAWLRARSVAMGGPIDGVAVTRAGANAGTDVRPESARSPPGVRMARPCAGYSSAHGRTGARMRIAITSADTVADGPVGRVDGLQRRRRALGIPIAVIYKFFDDQGGYLAAVLTHYSVLAILPLLLIASSVLGFVLQGHPGLEQQILTSALAQFPIVGDQLGRPGGIQGSTTAVVVGILAAAYGAIGLGQAAQNAVNVVWAIPRNSRLNPVVSRLRSLVWLVLAGLALVFVAVVTSLASHVEILGRDLGAGARWLGAAAAVAGTPPHLAIRIGSAPPRKEP